VLQVLTTAPRGIVEQFPKDHWRGLGPSDRRIVPPKDPGRGAGRMIEVSGLTVRFGGVTPRLDSMDVQVRVRHLAG